MSDQVLEQTGQRLERKISFAKGKKAAMDEAVAYAIDIGGEINALRDHVQRIRHGKIYPLRILQYTFPTWVPDYENQEFLAGIQAGCDAIEKIYNAPDWESKPFPVASGAPSKIVHDLRIGLLDVDGYLYGLQECLENKENLEAIRIAIKDWKNHLSREPNNKLEVARLQALEDGYEILAEWIGE